MVIAGPNLTIDRTLAIDELRPGEVLRFERTVVTPGGKGVNVARVARDLGADAVLVGLLPGRTGVAGAALLGDEGIVVRGVEVGGELRSTAVVLERSGRVTVLNEPGPSLAPGEWELYEGVVADALRGERVLACSGSLPPGAPADSYARLVGLAHAAGAVAIVDVGGEQLAAARRRRRRRGDAEPRRGRGPAARSRRRDGARRATWRSCASAPWRRRGHSSSAGRRARW